VLTHSLGQTAISVLRTGNADFTVAQKGVSDILYSAMDEREVESIRSYPGVDRAIGVLIAAVKLDADHPFFLELGINPGELEKPVVRRSSPMSARVCGSGKSLVPTT